MRVIDGVRAREIVPFSFYNVTSAIHTQKQPTAMCLSPACAERQYASLSTALPVCWLAMLCKHTRTLLFRASSWFAGLCERRKIR